MTTAFPWEERQPEYSATGFRSVCGNIEIGLGYGVYDSGPVLLLVVETVLSGPPRLWRKVWATKDSAAQVAEGLCRDIHTYLAAFRPIPVRPVEDLDMNDFVEHLKSRLQNEFH